MAEPPPPALLGPLKPSHGAVDTLARALALLERSRSDKQVAKAMIAELNPPRTFEALVSGQIKGAPVQLDMFDPPKTRKPSKPREPALYPAAREREQRALLLRKAGKTRREIADALSVTQRAVGRYFKKWRDAGELPPAVPGRPRP